MKQVGSFNYLNPCIYIRESTRYLEINLDRQQTVARWLRLNDKDCNLVLMMFWQMHITPDPLYAKKEKRFTHIVN